MSVIHQGEVEARIILSWTIPGRPVGFIPYSWFVKDETGLLNAPKETLFYQTFGLDPEARDNYVHKPPPRHPRGDWFSWDYDRRLRLTHIYAPASVRQSPMTWEELSKVAPFDDEVLAAEKARNESEAHKPVRASKPARAPGPGPVDVPAAPAVEAATTPERIWERAHQQLEFTPTAPTPSSGPRAVPRPPELRAERWHDAQPCPFCADKKVRLDFGGPISDGTWIGWVLCDGCRAMGPVVRIQGPVSRVHPGDDCPHAGEGLHCPAYKAWDAWNSRAPEIPDSGAPCSPCPFCKKELPWLGNFAGEWRMYCPGCKAAAPPGNKAELGQASPRTPDDRISAFSRWEIRWRSTAAAKRAGRDRKGT